jgi:tRNA pseudouridine38-40 synthase
MLSSPMMQRYFLEVLYQGTHYSGFQVQENAPTVQAAVEKAFGILEKKSIQLTGSSRTDSGVHALQNFFHFDVDAPLHPQFLYKINAILPADITVKNIYKVAPQAHCRFDATHRTYQYHIYQKKNPFLADRAYFFPYTIDVARMQEAAALLKTYTDFTSFSKRNTQVKTFLCKVEESEWKRQGSQLIYRVKANRFLRGMVRGLTGTLLQVGRGKLSLDDFRKIIEAKNCREADFAVPGHGLFLIEVSYPENTLLTIQ